MFNLDFKMVPNLNVEREKLPRVLKNDEKNIQFYTLIFYIGIRFGFFVLEKVEIYERQK